VASLGAEPEKILYFPNWAGEARLDTFAGSSQPIAGLPEGFRLVFAGNIGVAQDFETILAAMEQLDQYPDIHLVVVGEGRQGNWVKKQLPLQGLTNKVHLIGQRPITEMPAYFAAADALLVTLKAEPIFALTIPTKVQSYLACGKPIIAALNGEGAKVIVEAGAGLTCPSSDAIALAGIIKNVYEMSAQERENMGAKGKKYYQNNFDYSRLIIKLEEYINELCRKEQSCA
ncbi:MAG: glycosyltransferase family 4 protein, partial [bacterium]|nr:glycosyltransferase family 4 protein [bacterium]